MCNPVFIWKIYEFVWKTNNFLFTEDWEFKERNYDLNHKRFHFNFNVLTVGLKMNVSHHLSLQHRVLRTVIVIKLVIQGIGSRQRFPALVDLLARNCRPFFPSNSAQFRAILRNGIPIGNPNQGSGPDFKMCKHQCSYFKTLVVNSTIEKWSEIYPNFD